MTDRIINHIRRRRDQLVALFIGDRLELEDGSGFLLLEDGSYLLLE